LDAGCDLDQAPGRAVGYREVHCCCAWGWGQAGRRWRLIGTHPQLQPPVQSSSGPCTDPVCCLLPRLQRLIGLRTLGWLFFRHGLVCSFETRYSHGPQRRHGKRRCPRVVCTLPIFSARCWLLALTSRLMWGGGRVRRSNAIIMAHPRPQPASCNQGRRRVCRSELQAHSGNHAHARLFQRLAATRGVSWLLCRPL
jgi:hypothetical protein